MTDIELGSICKYRNESVSIDRDSYISTESMLPNKAGITRASSIPEKGKARAFYKGDTLISNIRPYFKKIWQADHDGCCSADVLVFESTSCDADYLYWLLSNDAFFNYMVATSKGTKMPRGDKKAIMQFKIRRMEIESQKHISDTLNPIRRLIELNQQTNDYLAELVRAEFDYRFGAESPTTNLGNAITISTQSLKPSACAGEIWEHYSIPAFDENRRPVFEPADDIKSNKYVIDNNCILISKLNPSTKRLWLPYCTSERPVCSTEFIVYKPKRPEYKSFYYAAIDSPAFTDFLLAHVTGSTGSRQRTQPKATLKYPMPNPNVEDIEDFCKFADPIIEKWQLNEQESTQLECLRDTLLPKLMSGKIGISKIAVTQLNNHLSTY